MHLSRTQSEANEQREAGAAAGRAGGALWAHAVQLHDGPLHRGRARMAHHRQRHLRLEVSRNECYLQGDLAGLRPGFGI